MKDFDWSGAIPPWLFALWNDPKSVEVKKASACLRSGNPIPLLLKLWDKGTNVPGHLSRTALLILPPPPPANASGPGLSEKVDLSPKFEHQDVDLGQNPLSEIQKEILSTRYIDIKNPPHWFLTILIRPTSHEYKCINLDRPPLWLQKMWRRSDFDIPSHLCAPKIRPANRGHKHVDVEGKQTASLKDLVGDFCADGEGEQNAPFKPPDSYDGDIMFIYSQVLLQFKRFQSRLEEARGFELRLQWDAKDIGKYIAEASAVLNKIEALPSFISASEEGSFVRGFQQNITEPKKPAAISKVTECLQATLEKAELKGEKHDALVKAIDVMSRISAGGKAPDNTPMDVDDYPEPPPSSIRLREQSRSRCSVSIQQRQRCARCKETENQSRTT